LTKQQEEEEEKRTRGRTETVDGRNKRVIFQWQQR
jgi:hypothetical protein